MSRRAIQCERERLLTNAASGSSREGDESIVVPIGGSFRQEVVRIEFFWVGVDLRVSVEFAGGNDDGCSSGNGVVSGFCRQINFLVFFLRVDGFLKWFLRWFIDHRTFHQAIVIIPKEPSVFQ